MGAGLVLGDCNAWFVHTGMEYLRIFNIVQIWNNVHEYIVHTDMEHTNIKSNIIIVQVSNLYRYGM